MLAEFFALLAGVGHLAGAYGGLIMTTVTLWFSSHPLVLAFLGIQLYFGRLLWGHREPTIRATIIHDLILVGCSPILIAVTLLGFANDLVRNSLRALKRAFTGVWVRAKVEQVRDAANRFWVWSKLALLKAWIGNHLEWVVAISFAAVIIVHQFKRFLDHRRERRKRRGLPVVEESSRISSRHMQAVDYLLNCLNIAAAIVGVAAFGWDGAKKSGFNTFVLRTWRSAMGSGAPHKHKDKKEKGQVNWKDESLAAYVRQQQEACSKVLAEFQGVKLEDLNALQQLRLEEARKNEAHWAKEAAKIGTDVSEKAESPFIKLERERDSVESEVEELDEELDELAAPINDTYTQAERIWVYVKKYGWAFTCVGVVTALIIGILYFIMEYWDAEEEVVKPAIQLTVTPTKAPVLRKRPVFMLAEAMGMSEKIPEARRYVNPSPDDFALNDIEEQAELKAMMEAKLEEMLERRFGGYQSESQRIEKLKLAGIQNEVDQVDAARRAHMLQAMRKAVDALQEKESEIVELESLNDDLSNDLAAATSKLAAVEARVREATAMKIRLAELEPALNNAYAERDEARKALMALDKSYAANAVGMASSKIGDLELEQIRLQKALEGKGKAHEGAKLCDGCKKPVDGVSPSKYCADCRKQRSAKKRADRAKKAKQPKVSESLEAELLKLASPEDVKEALQVNSALFTPKNGSSCVKMVGILDGTSETHFKNGTIVNGSLVTVKHGCNKALDVSTALAGHHGVADGSALAIPEVDLCVYPAPKGNWGPSPKVRRAKLGEKCFVAYYATPESTELTFGAHGTIQDVGDPVKRLSGVHTCSTQKGASGCGVWAESDGAFLGVHEGTKDGRNVFVPVDATQLGKALDGKAIAWPSRSGN